MHIDWKKMRSLIRVDLITMNGGKGNLKIIAILSILFFAAMGFAVSPIAGLYVPFLLGTFFVPMVFQNEMKYHCEKLWSLLPISRSDLVNARFLLAVGLFTGAGIVFYLLMLLSLRLKLWVYLEEEMVDLISMMADSNGFTELGFFNLCYFGAFSVGLIILSSSLRKYFKDSQAFMLGMLGARLKKSGKGEILAAVVILGILGLWILIVSGILPIGAFGAALIQLVSQLAGAADGFLLGAVFITIGVFQTIYCYVSTMIEYSEKEL